MAWKDKLSATPLKQGTGRLVVLAHQADIEEALGKGYSKLAIWQAMTADGVMPVSYATFTRALRVLHLKGADKKIDSKAKAFEFDSEEARQKKLI